MQHPDLAEVIDLLSRSQTLSSAEIQRFLGKSQATVSRALRQLGARVVRIGDSRATKYALPGNIPGSAPQQPIWWTDEAGRLERIGTLSVLSAGGIHASLDTESFMRSSALPWSLDPLRFEGFIGRARAKELSESLGLPVDLQRWGPIEHIAAAVGRPQLPGAISIGETKPTDKGFLQIDSGPALSAQLDEAASLATLFPMAGSSAGGEQPKYLVYLSAPGRNRSSSDDVDHANDANGAYGHCIVKFSPRLDTPFGQRWRDLLRMEEIASRVLEEAGCPTARARLVVGKLHAHLVVERFDRVGATGKRHTVSLEAVHQHFVGGPRQNWARSCEALVGARLLPPMAAFEAAALLDFGRLIGNNDMHFGNLSLMIPREGLVSGRGMQLAPVYDMLPMRWRPTPSTPGDWSDYSPFEPDEQALLGPAGAVAEAFWREVASSDVSPALQEVAQEMAQRCSSPRHQEAQTAPANRT